MILHDTSLALDRSLELGKELTSSSLGRSIQSRIFLILCNRLELESDSVPFQQAMIYFESILKKKCILTSTELEYMRAKRSAIPHPPESYPSSFLLVDPEYCLSVSSDFGVLRINHAIIVVVLRKQGEGKVVS